MASAAASAAAPPSNQAAEAAADPNLSTWLGRTLVAADARWSDWLGRAKELRLQILVSVVEPDGQAGPTYELRVDEEYFYPASAIKPFMAVAALRAMSKRVGGDISPLTRIQRCREGRPECEPPPEDEEKDDAGAPGSAAPDDEGGPRKKHEKLRVGEEIAKMLSYSDNDSYNRLWDVVGHREVNELLVELGFPAVRMHHRMDAPAERSRTTPRVLLLAPGKPIIELRRRKSELRLPPTDADSLLVGTAYHDGGKRVHGPMSFAEKNYAPLRELQRLLREILFPEREPGAKLGLSDAQRELLVKPMTAKLAKTRQTADHHPLAPGVLEVLPADEVRYVGKSGRAYGFQLENAYLERLSTRRALFVTATVYANPNGVLNDDDYGYDDISRPLLASLGAALARALLVR